MDAGSISALYLFLFSCQRILWYPLRLRLGMTPLDQARDKLNWLCTGRKKVDYTHCCSMMLCSVSLLLSCLLPRDYAQFIMSVSEWQTSPSLQSLNDIAMYSFTPWLWHSNWTIAELCKVRREQLLGKAFLEHKKVFFHLSIQLSFPHNPWYQCTETQTCCHLDELNSEHPCSSAPLWQWTKPFSLCHCHSMMSECLIWSALAHHTPSEVDNVIILPSTGWVTLPAI